MPRIFLCTATPLQKDLWVGADTVVAAARASAQLWQQYSGMRTYNIILMLHTTFQTIVNVDFEAAKVLAKLL